MDDGDALVELVREVSEEDRSGDCWNDRCYIRQAAAPSSPCKAAQPFALEGHHLAEVSHGVA